MFLITFFKNKLSNIKLSLIPMIMIAFEIVVFKYV